MNTNLVLAESVELDAVTCDVEPSEMLGAPHNLKMYVSFEAV